MGPAQDLRQDQIPAPDPNPSQHGNMDQGSQAPATNLSTSSDTGGYDNLSSGELIINGCAGFEHMDRIQSRHASH